MIMPPSVGNLPMPSIQTGERNNSFVLPDAKMVKPHLDKMSSLPHPFVGVVGGVRLKEKTRLIATLIERGDELILGGGIAFVFLKAMNNVKIGKSFYDEESGRIARQFMEKAEERNVTVHLPVDFLCAASLSSDAETRICTVAQGIPDGWFGVDMGPETCRMFSEVIARARTVVWTGPLGMFENRAYSRGTQLMLQDVIRATENNATTVIGGVATTACLDQLGAKVEPAGPSPQFIENPALPMVFKTASMTISRVINTRQRSAVSLEPEEPGKTISVKEHLESDNHRVDLDVLQKRLGTSVEKGLTEKQVHELLRKHGPNCIQPPKKNWFKTIMGWLFSDFGSILWVAALLCFLAWRPLGDPPDPNNLGLGILILIVIGVSVTFTAYQEHSSSEVMKTIKQMLPSHAKALRGGDLQTVELASLVPGDIVFLEGGDRIPADMRLFDVDDIKMDQSLLTGESEAVVGSITPTDDNPMESHNMAFTGTNVVEGRGRGVVLQTGNNTVTGKIASLTASSSTSRTPLQEEIHYFVVLVSCIAISVALICLIAWAAWLRTSYPTFIETSGIITTLIGALVAFIPEGMPVCVTLTLTSIARTMLKSRVLVKNLVTVETLGSVEILASDKTGTLTQNRMSVANVCIDTQVYGQRALPDEQVVAWNVRDEAVRVLVEAGVLCNQAVLDPSTADMPLQDQKAIGNSTDAALFMFAHAQIDVAGLRSEREKLAEVPFNSRNKWMLSVFAVPPTDASDEKFIVLLKGAPEAILSNCISILGTDGKVRQMSPQDRDSIAARQEYFSEKGMRVIGICQCELDKRMWSRESFDTFGEDNLASRGGTMHVDAMCMLGLYAIIDPARPEVPEALAVMRRAGIRIAMVTGDHPTTAVAIARNIGLVTSERVHKISRDVLRASSDIEEGLVESSHFPPNDAIAIKGVDIDDFDDATWEFVTSRKEIVFARTTPEHKLEIVKQFQSRDKMVAVTGDGVNDSPALKQSDLGIAMGAGSDVAREAADMVLLSNDFSSITEGIRLGRLVHDNLKKVCLYLLPAGTFSEVLPIILNIFIGIPLALSSFEMIFISCGTDLVTSLPLISEKAEADVMQRKPRHRVKDRLINWELLVHAYFFLGVMTTFGCFFMYFFYYSIEADIQPSSLFLAFDKYNDGYLGLTGDQLDEHLYFAQTCYFVALIVIQTCNMYATRTRRVSLFQQPPYHGPTANYSIIVWQVISIMMALIVVYVPVFNDLFKTRPIKAYFWFFPIVFGIMEWGADELRKWWNRAHPLSFLVKISW